MDIRTLVYQKEKPNCIIPYHNPALKKTKNMSNIRKKTLGLPHGRPVLYNILITKLKALSLTDMP
jgi:hypothetical protein